MITSSDILAKAFPKRRDDLHKYSAGTVTIVGGSAHFIHAPVLSALGARSAGAGLIQLVVPDASRIASGALVPEATFTKQTPVCVPPRADVTAVGMGLSATQTAEMLVSRLLSGSAGHFVLDADALTILANWYAAQQTALPVTDGQTLVITPHAGEAARLLACTPEDIQKDRMGAIKQIVERYHAITVLKGAHTLVSAPGINDVYQCEAGNPFMALGGMGDLLSGVIAARWARLARNNPAEDKIQAAFIAACSSVWLHAKASDNIVTATPPGDPSVQNTAMQIASLRVQLERS